MFPIMRKHMSFLSGYISINKNNNLHIPQIVILRALSLLMHDRLVLVFLGFRGEALNQSRSDSGVYTGLLLYKPRQP